MNIQAPVRMTVDEFLVWALDRPGRYELVDGTVYQMSPERALHAETKAACFIALKAAIKTSGLNLFPMPDGMTVRINDKTAFEPDALVYVGPRMGPKDVEVKTPVIVVEVLSPSTRGYDSGGKLTGYFSLPGIHHYLIVDADQQTVVHHRRQDTDKVATEIRRDGDLFLDPPGLVVPVAEFFAID
jgi:Uma2 family endonuclease